MPGSVGTAPPAGAGRRPRMAASLAGPLPRAKPIRLRRRRSKFRGGPGRAGAIMKSRPVHSAGLLVVGVDPVGGGLDVGCVEAGRVDPGEVALLALDLLGQVVQGG